VVPNIISGIIGVCSILAVDAIIENIFSDISRFAARSAEQKELLSTVGCDILQEGKKSSVLKENQRLVGAAQQAQPLLGAKNIPIKPL